jgi:hypothetical protein
VQGGAAFIYLALIGMWALVLVPLFLRRHDQAQESRSADRFARAMGSLRLDSRGTASAGESRALLMPRRSDADRRSQVTVSNASAYETPGAAAARRRRLVLAVLGSLLVVWTVLVVLHKVPRLSLAVPALLFVGFLVVARRQAARAADLKRRRARRSALTDAARAADVRYDSSQQLARRGGRVVEAAPQRRPQPKPAAAPVVEAPAADGTSWSAVPTTLPTYVTAPRATRIPRVIDLTTPGSWSGAAMVAQARETLAAEPADESGMRVESFEIAVPRDPSVRASVYVEPAAYSDRYIDDDRAIESLFEDDDENLATLLDDPRTGVHGPTWRRAANG